MFGTRVLRWARRRSPPRRGFLSGWLLHWRGFGPTAPVSSGSAEGVKIATSIEQQIRIPALLKRKKIAESNRNRSELRAHRVHESDMDSAGCLRGLWLNRKTGTALPAGADGRLRAIPAAPLLTSSPRGLDDHIQIRYRGTSGFERRRTMRRKSVAN